MIPALILAATLAWQPPLTRDQREQMHEAVARDIEQKVRELFGDPALSAAIVQQADGYTKWIVCHPRRRWFRFRMRKPRGGGTRFVIN